MRRRTGVAAAVALALGGMLLATVPAAAVQPANLTIVTNPDPVNYTPNVLDGQVNTIAEVGDTVLVGGSFSQVQDALGGPVLSRSNLFAYDATTGAILSTFTPNVPSTVYEIVPTGDGQTAYVGGQFNNINGAARTNRLARINATTGVTDPTFISPGFDGIVKDLQVRNGLLYIAGTFLIADSLPRSILAAVDPATGALSPAVDLAFTDPRNGGALQVIKFDITPDGSKLFAIGNFTKVNGADRYQVVRIDLTATSATVGDWQTTRYTTACASAFDTYMRDIDVSSDGSYFVIGTTGAYSGGVGSGTLCDGIARWETATSGANQQPTWVDYTGGDTLWSVAAGGEAVYAGGHFRWFNNPFRSDSAGQGAVAREGIAALDPRNGLPLTWNPGRERGIGAFALHATNRGLYVGSDTERIGNFEYHGRLALFPATGGTEMPDDYTGQLPGNVYSLGANSTDVVTRRAFTGTSVTSSASVSNGGVTWNNSRGAFMVDGKLYVGVTGSGNSPGTLQVRSFDGTTFGAPTLVNLNGLTNFGTELRTITGMFLDTTTGRLYFTLSGTSQLFYRYFTSESAIVGAVRFNGPTNLSDLNWSQVSSMFKVGDHLYVASSVDGNLRRYQWNSATGSPVAGTGTVVSGTALDGQNWRARGAFVLAPANGGNLAPTAAFSSECAGLQCAVDSSSSTDSDGTIVARSWDFGDGGTATTNTANHLYADAGTYQVSLTVTDNDGATNTVTQPVTVTAPASPVAFRAAAGADASSNQVAVTIPASVQAGDALLMIATVNATTPTVGTPTGVTGWTQVNSLSGNTVQSVLWRKTATATDAGAIVRVPLSTTAKISAQVLAYSGSTAANPVSAAAGALETVTRAAHTTPTVTVAAAGSYLVSYWADKTTDTTSWTLPAGLTTRNTTLGTGSGHLASISADAGTGAGVGTAGGLTATANSANSKAVMWSVVIAP
jgi:PKD repeat protein